VLLERTWASFERIHLNILTVLLALLKRGDLAAGTNTAAAAISRLGGANAVAPLIIKYRNSNTSSFMVIVMRSEKAKDLSNVWHGGVKTARENL
jgi:ABC-type hemin transport system substrate-binding protein